MIEAFRALFAPKRGRDDAQQNEEQAKRRAEIDARAVDSTSAGGAFDGTGDTESAEKRDNGVARGGQGTSGAEPTGGADENPAEEATNTGKGKRKCVLCNRADARRTVSMFFVGALVFDMFDSVFDRYSRIKKKQIGRIDKNQTFRQGDGLCAACSALFEDCVRDRLDWKFEWIVDAARKLKILSAHVRDHLDGKLPRCHDVATLARWDHEDAGERDGVQVGLWWYDLNRSKCEERLKRLINFDEDSNNALQYLETCVLREDGCARRYTAHDARKLKIFSAHVRDHLDGKLPRANDVATLARWDHEDAGERDGVPVGWWWYSLNHSTDKERLKRLRKFDEDSKHALEYLETCVLREDGSMYTAHDARKLTIFSAHVRDHLDGKLPRQKDVATLARWDHEDAGERDGVLVGKWWNELNHPKCEDRLKRLRNFDEDSKHALEYLETCEPRKAKKQGRKAK
ncbi:unnamed product [Ostreococcus tauri]|uniref:Unnamed product n=1 Tax=Ostreococcus tauri TaxID=70448 RepID=A0A090M409_OSTTA|nr:unnamed product [Ostreococcus tauri]OUS44175.1 hypothetical protein BE221DRAFT_118771 [Ostreococcus tauri]CEF97387.1 unnamed product [Ostreococcus tauri]|eukprot:XP_022838663.1 unnamed product [Ostreococcus tauri]